VVAAYDDRVLVVPKPQAQRVRDVVAELREEGLF
jgi:mannose-1-phosphate guanylyltransferase